MNLQPAVKRELQHISVGVAAGSIWMVCIFALAGAFAWPVVWGALLGAVIAVGNFYYLCRSVQRAAANTAEGRRIMRASYTMRMLITIAGILLGLAAPWFHWLAVVIPLLLPRLTIYVMQWMGAYRPEQTPKGG